MFNQLNNISPLEKPMNDTQDCIFSTSSIDVFNSVIEVLNSNGFSSYTIKKNESLQEVEDKYLIFVNTNDIDTAINVINTINIEECGSSNSDSKYLTEQQDHIQMMSSILCKPVKPILQIRRNS
jgi:hypothetical protein